MQLRHLRYLVVLASERHFARAAAACHITQSTLSAAIRALEDELRAPIVQRDRRFRDFTPEGRARRDWARRILAEREALEQELARLGAGLAGHLRLGVIPTALPVIALLTNPLHAAYPDVRLTILSRSSIEI